MTALGNTGPHRTRTRVSRGVTKHRTIRTGPKYSGILH